MNFNSQICTSREQSRRLLALGLKPETADMAQIENWDYDLKDGKFFTGEYFERPIDYTEGMDGHYIPAWSLHRLLMMLDSDVQTDGRYISLPNYGFVKKDNIYDNLCDCIEWLIKKESFNKEYLV